MNMKAEDKELLLKDLCARLPYGVHLFTNSKHHIRLLTISNDIDYNEQYWVNGLYDIDEVKPYLRLMSSMTEEEENEYAFLLNDGGWGVSEELVTNIIDWLNAHHFDYRGFIEKGLALEAPEGMYN
jgi:hypothetical protein